MDLAQIRISAKPMARKSNKGSKPTGFGEEHQATLDPEQPEKVSATSKAPATASPPGAPASGPAERRLLKIGADGRVLIPADWREAMLLEENDRLVAFLQDGELRLHGSAVGLRKAQAIARKYIRPGESIVDELIAERREEARREKSDS